MAKKSKPRLTVLVSSSIYGREPLLEQIAGWLGTFGYEVWNSHLGTLPIELNAGTYDTCIRAAERCDIFLGLITPRYGSGTDGEGGPAITHRELSRAIELRKPRLVLAHEHVVLARRIMMDLGYKGIEGRKELTLRKGAEVIDDLRLVDMYEEATQDHLDPKDRDDNWVQKYSSDADVGRYIGAQFGRYEEMEQFVARWREKMGNAS